MKKYTTEMMRLIAIIIVTPILVAAYTKIEKAVSVSVVDQTQGGAPGITPVSIGLLDKENNKDTDINSTLNNDYILVRPVLPVNDFVSNGKGLSQQTLISNRFALVLL